MIIVKFVNVTDQYNGAVDLEWDEKGGTVRNYEDQTSQLEERARRQSVEDDRSTKQTKWGTNKRSLMNCKMPTQYAQDHHHPCYH